MERRENVAFMKFLVFIVFCQPERKWDKKKGDIVVVCLWPKHNQRQFWQLDSEKKEQNGGGTGRIERCLNMMKKYDYDTAVTQCSDYHINPTLIQAE